MMKRAGVNIIVDITNWLFKLESTLLSCSISYPSVMIQLVTSETKIPTAGIINTKINVLKLYDPLISEIDEHAITNPAHVD